MPPTPARPRALVTLLGHDNTLSSADKEAQAVMGILKRVYDVTLIRNPSIEVLNDALSGCSLWWFVGHGDAPLQGECVLAFHDAGAIQTVSLDTLKRTVKKHTGTLRQVVLAACKTFDTAKALKDAGVASIMYWSTLLVDSAASDFGQAFAHALTEGKSLEDAMDEASTAVGRICEDGELDTGKTELEVTPE